jgi:hypothetical protein
LYAKAACARRRIEESEKLETIMGSADAKSVRERRCSSQKRAYFLGSCHNSILYGYPVAILANPPPLYYL